MVPADCLSFRFVGSEVIPHYFLERDHLWLRSLLDEYVRYEGKPRRELVERLADPLPVRAPEDKLRVARRVLDRMWRFRAHAAVEPKRARATLFAEGSRHADRAEAIARASAALDVKADALLDGLFADLPYEKVLVPPERLPSVAELTQRANLALVAGMLRRAVAVSVEADSNLRAVVRQAKWMGLLCIVRERSAHHQRERLEISGPYTLFRRTLMYGRALARLVPIAAHCQDMELRAACVLDDTGETRTLVIRSGDPLFPAPEPKRHDSKLEARFFRDFAKAAPDWDVAREPAAVPVEGTLIFPDFELRHRRDPERRWLLEIAGFWTPGYIEEKLRRLRKANLSRFILCIDEERNCSADELPEQARVVRYRRRIDPQAVLQVIAPASL